MSANPKIVQGQETRQRLVDAAVAVIEDPGKSMTTKSLLDEAKITKGAVYHHFQSLDELWLEAFEAIVRGREPRERFVDKQATSLSEYLSGIGNQFQARLADSQAQAATWGILVKAVADESNDYKDLLVDLVYRTVDELVDQGKKFLPQGVGTDELRKAILGMQGLWLGLLAQLKTDGNYQEKKQVLDWYINASIRALMQPTDKSA